MTLSSPAEAPRPAIWILDDSPTETEAIRAALGASFLVSHYRDGASLIESLDRLPPPVAVVLDWELPGLSGIEVCEYLRSNPATETLPVLLLTVHQSTEDVERGLEAGANDYVSKPFRPIELAARAQALVRREKRRKQVLAEERSRRVLAEDALEVVRAAEERARRAEAERAHLLEREQQARRAVEALEAETRQRADFERQLIGIVSHDLRNPLSAILLTASLMERKAADERQKREVERIRVSAERATRMIRDLLDFTQARQGNGIAIQRKTADLHAVVRSVVDEAQVTHPERTIEVAQRGNGTGQWDSDRLAQVVANLLGNALQYSPAGTPVRVELHDEGESLLLRVHNTGAPIPHELLPRIFEPMERGAAILYEAGRSIGLGLYIVRHVVLAHAGTVNVHSSATEGTSFTVRLPRSPPAAQG